MSQVPSALLLGEMRQVLSTLLGSRRASAAASIAVLQVREEVVSQLVNANLVIVTFMNNCKG